jgi:hypothetical protein
MCIIMSSKPTKFTQVPDTVTTSFGIKHFVSQEDWTEENICRVKKEIETKNINTHEKLRSIIGNQSKKKKLDKNGTPKQTHIFNILRDNDQPTNPYIDSNFNDFFENHSSLFKKFFKGSDFTKLMSVDKKIEGLFNKFKPMPYDQDELDFLKYFGVDKPTFEEKATDKKGNPVPQYKQTDETKTKLKRNITEFITAKDSRFDIFKNNLLTYFKGKFKYDTNVEKYIKAFPTLTKETAGQIFVDELKQAFSLLEKENELYAYFLFINPEQKDAITFDGKTAVKQSDNHFDVEKKLKKLYEYVSFYLEGPNELIREAKNYQKYLKYKAKYIALKSKLNM